MQRSYPAIFFKPWETITCHLLQPKFKDLKNFTVKEFRQYLIALTVKLSILKNKRTSHPDFDKHLQIGTCSAKERHRMKKSKFQRL